MGVRIFISWEEGTHWHTFMGEHALQCLVTHASLGGVIVDWKCCVVRSYDQ